MQSSIRLRQQHPWICTYPDCSCCEYFFSPRYWITHQGALFSWWSTSI